MFGGGGKKVHSSNFRGPSKTRPRGAAPEVAFFNTYIETYIEAESCVNSTEAAARLGSAKFLRERLHASGPVKPMRGREGDKRVSGWL
ncbi:hypothetical protein QOZ99_000170 [Angulomicrobium amanitiforme]|uniref:Uncharacterized protein n=1 Tax=Ancylobacter amanitiformis TaxID=217069 RepID=A0ABU0LKZ8_9HYPH|nr:hypothetical protein [Ancylobacter amanitiformis]